jgi:hypothetical protein
MRGAGVWGSEDLPRECGTMRAKTVKDLIRFSQRVPELNGIGFLQIHQKPTKMFQHV